jgi:hypothetical protein
MARFTEEERGERHPSSRGPAVAAAAAVGVVMVMMMMMTMLTLCVCLRRGREWL